MNNSNEKIHNNINNCYENIKDSTSALYAYCFFYKL
jgi:hypothetical protein